MQTFLNKIFGAIKTNKLFFHDALWNMVAFMVYICSQQILLLPIMAKLLDSESYGDLILYITIMNVFCNVLGGQIGVTHQLQKKIYGTNAEEEHSDFLLLMLGASLLIAICFPIILFVLKFDAVSVIFITITVIISNFRLYIRYHFRITSTYKRMIIQNVFYLAGIVIGLVLYPLVEIMWLPLFAGEIFGLVFTLFAIPLKIVLPRKTSTFAATLKRYSGLGSADALTNLVTLIDKLLIYPVMGAHSLAVYNSGAATSKIAALIVNPLNEVILVKLSKAKDAGRSKLLKTVILVSIVSCAIIFVVLIPVIYLFSYILYRQYLQEICTIIIFLSLSCAVGFTASILKSFILRYAKPIRITICYLINVCFLAIGGIIGAKFWELAGFACAVTLGSVERWLSFIFVLLKCMKEETYEK